MEVDGGSVLNTAAVEMKQTEMFARENEQSNEAPIRLLDEYLPKVKMSIMYQGETRLGSPGIDCNPRQLLSH